MLAGSLRQCEPVMPVAQYILHALHYRDEPLGCGRRLSELGRVARPLAQDAILVQQRFGDARAAGINQDRAPTASAPKLQGRLTKIANLVVGNSR